VSNEPIKDNFQRAFEIHKDADSQLHTRVSTFVVSQSFLVAGYFNSYQHRLHFMMPILGLLFCYIYFKYCNRLVNGIEFLKQQYLERLPNNQKVI